MKMANRQLRACGGIFGVLLLLFNVSTAFADNTPSPCDLNPGIQAGLCASPVPGGIGVTTWLNKNEQSSGQQKSDSSSTVDDQKAKMTAEETPAASSQPFKRCVEVFVGKAANSPIVSDDATVVRCDLPPDPEGGPNQDPGRVPTTRDILYMAATIIHADGAGLYKRPLGVSYTNKYIPSIVAVTSPTQTHVINLLGHDITITLTATSYEWSWGDGTPNLVTTSTGSVWQDGMDLNTDPRLIRHYYTPPQGWRSMLDGPYPHEDREITLTTTWSGTATNPFTGETQTINGLVTTTETTGKFPLSHLVINNTDTWEEKQGH